MSRVALVTSAPRNQLPPRLCGALDLVVGAIKRSFVDAARIVRNGLTFRALADCQRAEMEAKCFRIQSANEMITTARRLEYFPGFLELGLIDQASDELEAIEGTDRLSAEVMGARVNLYLAATNWDLLLAVSRGLAHQTPENDHGWIHWAYALRELGRVPEPKAVLLEAETLHGKTCALLHYNLACYECLLCDFDEARRRLKLAYKFDKAWKRAALDDPDLKALRGDTDPSA